jgi:hypothetical protein
MLLWLLLMLLLLPNNLPLLPSLEVLQLQHSTGIFDPGSPSLKMTICIAIVYSLLYISLFKGVKSSGSST